jgi:hypothetical protein
MGTPSLPVSWGNACRTPNTRRLIGTSPSSLRSLAVCHKDQTVLPIQILDAHPEQLPFISHSPIAHQKHNIAEEFKCLLPPFANRSTCQQSTFRLVIKPKMPPTLLHHFDFRSVADHLPLLSFVSGIFTVDGESAGDLSPNEATDILDSGLALMPVKRVRNQGWSPNQALRQQDGQNAVTNAQAVGFATGVNVWCHLEGVSSAVQPQDVIDYAKHGMRQWTRQATYRAYMSAPEHCLQGNSSMICPSALLAITE